jgi:hypothetical protein
VVQGEFKSTGHDLLIKENRDEFPLSI